MKNHLIIALACCLSFVGCRNDKVNSSQYDPSQPIVLTDFSPKEEGMRARLYIEDGNLENDPTKIHITIGEGKTRTIGTDGRKAYCMVPSRTLDGIIDVCIDDPDGKPVVEHTFEEELRYTPATIVGTLPRRVDKDNNSTFQEGPSDEGTSILSNNCMMFDPKYKDGDNRLFFSSSHFGGLHLINLAKRIVEYFFPKTGCSTMYPFTFSINGDTLLFTDDHGQDNATRADIHYSLRRENFRQIRPCNYGRIAYSLVYMDDGTIFYTIWRKGKIYRMIRNGVIPNIDENAEVVFSLSQISAVGDSHTILFRHPSNKFMHVPSDNFGAVLRADYDSMVKILDNPSITAENVSDKSFRGETGGNTRFGKPQFGILVKNEKYSRETGPDNGQYSFYSCNRESHCIWKLDPYGVASLAAGRSNGNVDSKIWGYIDGNPLHGARFNQSADLAYDPDTDMLYIGDVDNKGIRYITTEQYYLKHE